MKRLILLGFTLILSQKSNIMVAGDNRDGGLDVSVGNISARIEGAVSGLTPVAGTYVGRRVIDVTGSVPVGIIAGSVVSASGIVLISEAFKCCRRGTKGLKKVIDRQ